MLDLEQLADLQVLPGLGHDAFVRGDDQGHQVHAGGAGHHVAHEALVARDVDDAQVAGRWAGSRSANPSSMVMPRSFSSFRRSGSTPVRALIRELLPWSMWPAVPKMMGAVDIVVQ